MLDSVQQLADILESLATVIAICVAGCWSYLLFVRRRQRFPRAAVSHQTFCFQLPDGRSLLRVAAKIVNTGEVLMQLRFARTRVQQLLPLPDHVAQLLAVTAIDPVPTKDCELPWTVLGAREWRIDAEIGEVEPGESEAFHCDFVIPAGVEQVLVYTHVKNHSKPDRDVGWSDTIVVSLKEEELFVPQPKQVPQPSRDPSWEEKQLPPRRDPDTPPPITPQLPARPDPTPPPPRRTDQSLDQINTQLAINQETARLEVDPQTCRE